MPAHYPAVVRIFFFVALSVTVAGCSSDASGDVSMEGRSFEPNEFRVAVGDTVTWANSSSELHTVTAYTDGLPDGAGYFASSGAPDENAARDDLSAGLLKISDTFKVTFDVPGTYRYFCIPHESSGMTGTIIVEP